MKNKIDYKKEYDTLLKEFHIFVEEKKKGDKLIFEFTVLKNYYEPFKEFLQQMFLKGDNTDLESIKEWLDE